MTIPTATSNYVKNIEYLDNTMFVLGDNGITFYSEEYTDAGVRNIYYMALTNLEISNIRCLKNKYDKSNLVLQRIKRRLMNEKNLITLSR